jgi:hypothetical protein
MGGFNQNMRNSNQGTQVFYDDASGRYYTQAAPQRNDPFALMFGQTWGKKLGEKNRNYLTDFNSPKQAVENTPYNYVDIAALFPELAQAATGMQGDSQASAGLLGGQGAAQSASSGAGRFM